MTGRYQTEDGPKRRFICSECGDGIVGNRYVVFQLSHTYKVYHPFCADHISFQIEDGEGAIPKNRLKQLVSDWEDKAADYEGRGFTEDHANYLDCAADLRDLLNRY